VHHAKFLFFSIDRFCKLFLLRLTWNHYPPDLSLPSS
jgi:hypothetical protein